MDRDNLTEKQNHSVYNPTTKPKKAKNRNKSDLGENFVAPDGGWAWIVCIAAGVSNLVIFPNLQQFGLIFRDRLYDIGMTNSQITTIVNVQPAVSSFTGLINGAMFRRFSCRQIAFAGSIFSFIGIFFCAFADSFWSYIIFFSMFFGFGMGITTSASALALNTYFKKNRRRAMGFSWTITGIGPIFLPHVVTMLLYYYDFEGTVIIFAALTLHSLVASLVFQPVHWHTKSQPKPENKLLSPEFPEDDDYMCKFCELNKMRKPSIFSSQYLFSEDDTTKAGFEVIGPGTPMMPRANDGWYGSKLSLSSDRSTSFRGRNMSVSKDPEEGRLDRVPSQEELPTGELFKPNNFHREKEEIDLYTSKLSLYSDRRCTCAEEKLLMQKTRENTIANSKITSYTIEKSKDRVPFHKKIVTFLDLDLFRDLTFVNLAVGLTIIIFGELNFSILTPFILNDFGFSNQQISTSMSIIGGMDLAIRFVCPFVTEKINWDNKVFFSFGMICIALGRGVVAMTRNYTIILVAFAMIGFGKALRTVFAPLIIPGHVPLNRLPAASGLQLLLTGIFTLSCGPLVGMVTDAYGYSVTIHAINTFTFLAIGSWATQGILASCRKERKQVECVSVDN